MKTASPFVQQYLQETHEILNALDLDAIEDLAQGLAKVRARGGRLFILGVGGSAGTASHAVNDFRKLCNIETYTPVDNVSELSARTNDEGWDTVFEAWLDVSRFNQDGEDAILVLSVGGGNLEKNVSPNLVKALEKAKAYHGKIFGIVGKDGGYTKKVADVCIIIPPIESARITPHTEGLASVILHLLVSHPALQLNKTKW